MLIKKNINQKISLRFFVIYVVLLFLPLLLRLVYMQIYWGNIFLRQAEQNRITETITKAVRGLIFDKDGNILAKNIPNFQLILDGTLINIYDENIFQSVSKLTGIDEPALSNYYLSSKKQGTEVILKNFLPYDEALTLLVSLNGYSGFSVRTSFSREYLAGAAFSHILGYLAPITDVEHKLKPSYLISDVVGKAGVEENYEDFLRGQNGVERIEVNAQGKPQRMISQTPVKNGQNLTLAIDTNLQNDLYAEIQNFIQKNKLKAGAAVALDPLSGRVRALVSYPSYDNNLFTRGVSSEEFNKLINNSNFPLFNRALAAEYPSGSIFKPIVAAAALEEKIITTTTEIMSTGGITIDKYFFPDWKPGGHGATNVTKAIAQSVNSFFYYIGGGDNSSTTGLGVERIVSYAQRFGLGSLTGIDLDNEQDGFLPSPSWKEEFKNEKWYIGDTYHLAIGQGDLLVTPLQMAVVTSIIANGGTFYRPLLADSYSAMDNSWRKEMESVIIDPQVVSTSTINIVRAGMRSAVLEGSAQLLQTLPVAAAAKTGTAQTGISEKTHSWLTVFAPYPEPEIALAIIIEEGGEGNDAALPIAQKVLNNYFKK